MGIGTFTIAYLAIAAFLFIPGFLAGRALTMSRLESLCLAPAFSVTIAGVLGVAFGAFGVFGNWINLYLVPSLALLALVLVERIFERSRRGKHAERVTTRSEDFWPILLYIAVGLVLVGFLFVGNLNSMAGFQPDNDNAFHLGLIKSMAQSGHFSTLAEDAYADTATSPSVGAGFYPIAFHIVTACAVNALGLNVPLAENATVAVILSLIYPLGTYWGMSRVFKDDPLTIYAGAFTGALVIAFPWRFLTWGPLLPNLFSLALVPAAIGAFYQLYLTIYHRRRVAVTCFAFIVACCGVGLAHPNGVFSLVVLLVPLAMSCVWQLCTAQGNGHPNGWQAVWRFIAPLLLLLVAVAGWLFLFSLPAFRNVVGFAWPPFEDFGSGVVDALSLRLSDTSAHGQPLMAVLAIVGLCSCCVPHKGHKWLIGLYAFVVVQYASCAAFDGPIRHVLCGFWYSDPNRIGANVGLAVVPLAALGVSSLIRLAAWALGPREAESPSLRSGGKRLGMVALGGTVLALLVCVILFDSFSTRVGDTNNHAEGFTIPDSSVDEYTSLLRFKYNSPIYKGYDLGEQQFVDEALKLVPQGSLILNLPNDGSCFAYSLQNANVYYRNVSLGQSDTPGQTSESLLIRNQLCEVAHNSEVQDALRKLDAHYLLVLDQGVTTQDLDRVLPAYSPDQWQGIIGVQDGTPGFEVLLAQDDMRLYRIDY